MADGIGNTLGLKRLHFSSAGVVPRPVDTKAVQFMREKGIDISSQTPKHLNEILNLKEYEAIISLCEEAEKGLPSLPKMVLISWEIEDLSKVDGSEADVKTAYEKTFQYLDTHIRDLVQAIIEDDIKRKETDVQ